MLHDGFDAETEFIESDDGSLAEDAEYLAAELRAHDYIKKAESSGNIVRFSSGERGGEIRVRASALDVKADGPDGIVFPLPCEIEDVLSWVQYVNGY